MVSLSFHILSIFKNWLRTSILKLTKWTKGRIVWFTKELNLCLILTSNLRLKRFWNLRQLRWDKLRSIQKDLKRRCLLSKYQNLENNWSHLKIWVHLRKSLMYNIKLAHSMVTEETFSKYRKESTPKLATREATFLRIQSIYIHFRIQMLCLRTYTDIINNRSLGRRKRKRQKKHQFFCRDKQLFFQ